MQGWDGGKGKVTCALQDDINKHSGHFFFFHEMSLLVAMAGCNKGLVSPSAHTRC